MDTADIRTRVVGEFLALAFGISWAGALVLYVARIGFDTLVGTVLLVVAFMWGPAIAAIVVARRRGQSVRKGCGLVRGCLRWLPGAWLLPVGLLVATVAVGAVLPGVSGTTDYATYFLESGLSEADAEVMVEILEALPIPAAAVLVLQALVVGATVNALAAAGEELGWRRLLLSEIADLEFWPVSLFTGVVWGLWHAPIIVQGYNFPESPVVGVAVMTVATVALAPIYTYVTVRARTVLAPTILHGTYNAVGGLALLYLAGAPNLVIAPVGLAGIVGALLVVVACPLHDRATDEQIVNGRPLSPW